MSIDYKYAERHFLYNDEQGSFRGLSVTTKAYAAYFGKLVDPDGGWIALGGRSPADALRRSCTGYVSRSDHRLLRRAVDELLEEGYLVLGELDETGEFLPLGSGDYAAIRDWVPAKHGMSRREAQGWHAGREARAEAYRAMQAGAVGTAVAGSPMPHGVEPARHAADATTTTAPRPRRRIARGTPTRYPAATDSTPTRHRSCTDRSGSSENSKGTEIALFHTIPDQIPPLSPKGESAHADRRADFPVEESAEPIPRARNLAGLAIEWLNAQQPTARFRADSHDAVTQARRWLAAGWDWRLVQTALELRLEALKAAKPDSWQDWATPGTLFNRKLARYVDEAQAGHRYRAAGSPPPPASEAEAAAARTQRLIAQHREELARAAEPAFRDVLEVVDLVGEAGDWEAELPDYRARAAVQQMGWRHVVAERAAAHDEFVRRYLGRL